MKNKRFFIIFCFILIDVFLVVGFLVIRDSISFNKLKSEVNELTKLDITKDRYNRKIKSHGVNIQYLSKMMNDEKLSSILSYGNYEKDAPSFKESLSYLEQSKKEYNEKIDTLITNLDDENIDNYIHTKIDDTYYVSLYHELIFETQMIDNLRDTKSLLEESKDKMNLIYDTCIETLNYLSLYNDKWKLEDGEIKFQTEDMYNYYMGLVSKIQKKDN